MAEHGTKGYEGRDLSVRPVALAALGLTAMVLLVFAAMVGLFDFYAGREAARSPAPNPLARSHGREVPPQPRLQTAPIKDLWALRAEENEVLTTYGWVDRDKGVVRIPIARAMQILAERGLPARPSSEAESAGQ